jgi:hypothetical protein
MMLHTVSVAVALLVQYVAIHLQCDAVSQRALVMVGGQEINDHDIYIYIYIYIYMMLSFWCLFVCLFVCLLHIIINFGMHVVLPYPH